MRRPRTDSGGHQKKLWPSQTRVGTERPELFLMTRPTTCHLFVHTCISIQLLTIATRKTWQYYGACNMTEHAYIRSVHDKLRKTAPAIYIWKINDPYQGGVADAYYSWHSDLWIEYKFLKSLPKRDSTVLNLGLSPLQKEWLRERHGEGRRVSVIVGSPDGALILPGLTWDGTITRADFLKSSVDKNMVVAYICRQLTAIN